MTRAALKLLLLVGMIVSGATGLHYYDESRKRDVEMERIKREAAEVRFQKEQLEGYIANLVAEQRVADIIVTHQSKAGDKVVSTTLAFFEHGRNGEVLAPRSFSIQGDTAHIDALVVIFDAEHVKKADPLRGRSLVLFYRLFGDFQTPAEAFPIDEPGQVPQIYSAKSNSPASVRDFQRELWQNVWKLAGDEAYRKQMGVKVLSRESPWGRFELDKQYTITVAAGGGLTMYPKPLDEANKAFRDAVNGLK